MSSHTADARPIGIFDSGIGGLTIAQAIHDRLPQEQLIYFGDTAHLPYGDKSLDTIYQYSYDIVQFLKSFNCKMIVIACNSASSAAYERLKEDLKEDDIVLINVIDPLVDRVIKEAYKKVGVIATKATIGSGVFQDKIEEKNDTINVAALATPLLAPMIEEGFYNGRISHAIIDNYLRNDSFFGIEAMLLACTHYPLIHDEIDRYFDRKVDIIDAMQLVADEVEGKLKEKDLLHKGEAIGKNKFFVSDYTESFDETAKFFYGSSVELETIHISERQI